MPLRGPGKPLTAAQLFGMENKLQGFRLTRSPDGLSPKTTQELHART